MYIAVFRASKSNPFTLDPKNSKRFGLIFSGTLILQKKYQDKISFRKSARVDGMLGLSCGRSFSASLSVSSESTSSPSSPTSGVTNPFQQSTVPRFRLKQINLQEQFIMAYGGLRGGVGFSLVKMVNR